MYLTEERLHSIALEARGGFRDCLNMIALHGGSRENSFLNPSIVLTAVATWERFAAELACAATDRHWRIEEAGWGREFDSTVPWPGSKLERRGLKSSEFGHKIDEVLNLQLTSTWGLMVANSWFGANPTEWSWADYGASSTSGNSDLIRRTMLGAKSARDAAAHRLYYKKANQADLRKRDGDYEESSDQRDWCYVWASDNTVNSATKRPTIQHGYARGVVAAFIQLADITIREVRRDRGWTRTDSQLPAGWFDSVITSGPCIDMTLWGGRELRQP